MVPADFAYPVHVSLNPPSPRELSAGILPRPKESRQDGITTRTFRDKAHVMKGFWVLPVGVLAGLLSAGDARAAFCGACSYSGPAVISSDQCAMPAVKHRIRYEPVTETHTQVCYRPVYQTVMEQQCYTVCKPVYEQHCREQRYTVCKPVTRVLRRAGPVHRLQADHEQHVREAPVHGQEAGRRVLPGRDPHDLPQGVRPPRRPGAVQRHCKPMVECYQVAVPYTTYRKEYEAASARCYSVPGRSSRSTRSRCRTRSAGRSTSNTSGTPVRSGSRSSSATRSRSRTRRAARNF